MEPAGAPGSPQPPGAGGCPCGTCGHGFPSFLMFLLASDQKRACYLPVISLPAAICPGSNRRVNE